MAPRFYPNGTVWVNWLVGALSLEPPCRVNGVYSNDHTVFLIQSFGDQDTV